MFNFLKFKKKDPYKYKMLCKHCDIFFETDNPNKKTCPACKQSKRTELYSVIDKKTDKETR